MEDYEEFPWWLQFLSMMVVLSSTAVYVPQIRAILNSQGSPGTSLLSRYLDLAGLTFTMVYSWHCGMPFTLWGECAIMSAEIAFICMLVIASRNQQPLVFLVVYLLILCALVTLAPHVLLAVLQGLAFPLVFTSKIVQIYTNFANGSTGELSGVTYSFLLLGSTIRLCTSFYTGDILMIFPCLTLVVTNSIICLQIWYYNRQ